MKKNMEHNIVNMVRRHLVLAVMFLSTVFVAGTISAANTVTYAEGVISLSTDSCQYAPGTEVTINITGSIPSGAKIRYRHGADVVGTPVALSSNTVKWTTPADNYTGYLADVYVENGNGSETIYATIGIDVSSTWNRFPRYGFVATYDDTKTSAVIAEETALQNRWHINGIQYYDWQFLHEVPYDKNNAYHLDDPRDASNNHTERWIDVAGRPILADVVRSYITEHHKYGMKTMFYNLLFGADEGYGDRGVSYDWSLFDGGHEQDFHPMPEEWPISYIFLRDPSNAAWQDFLKERNNEVYEAFDFDGYHIDQLGYRGDRYNANGDWVNLPVAYQSFINAMKTARPDKLLVMNGVSNYGGSEILATGNMEFSYTELWNDDDSFSEMERLVREHAEVNNLGTPSVFAAYMNYDCREEVQPFNTPGILLSDATMFAVGGSHLELGDGHMLCSEYFPHKNLTMSSELTASMTRYYDFMTAYENYLRDGGAVVDAGASCTNGVVSINSWPPSTGKVIAYSRQLSDCKVVSLLNFTATSDGKHLRCRDLDGDMPEPALKENIAVRISAPEASKVWIASPDVAGGAPHEVDFSQDGDYVTFTVPSLKYWTMLVIEQEEAVVPVVAKAAPMLVGSAVYCGWKPRNAAMMVRKPGTVNVYTYTGWFEAGDGKDFKFLTQCDWLGDEYRNGAGSTGTILGDGTLQLNGEDYKFKVAERGNYTVTVDLDNMTINVVKAAYQAKPIYYNVLGLIGDNTPGGWDLPDATLMTQDADNPFLFTAQLHMTAPVGGTFKIATNPKSSYDVDEELGGQDFFYRDNNNYYKVSNDGTDDRKWSVSNEDDYMIRVNLDTKDIDIWRAITIGPLGAATYCIDRQLDFTDIDDLKAYIVEGTIGSGDVQGLNVQEVTASPAGEGLLLLGTPGKYFVPTTDVSTDDCTGNKLVGILANTALTGELDGCRIYLLGNGSHGVGFYRSASGTLAANKAYLKLSSALGAKTVVLDANALTGINEITDVEADQTSFWYTLSGVKVLSPQRGIYIKEGKKIIVR